MRKVLVLFAVLHLVLMGCSFERNTPTGTEEESQITEVAGPANSSAATPEPLVTFWVESDEVSVASYTEDSANHLTSLALVRVLPSQEVLHYTYVVEKPHDEAGFTVCGATLLSEENKLLFALDYQWVTDDPEPNWLEVSEQTTDDKLVIIQQIDGIRVVETYTLNGETREFVYDNLDLPVMERISPEDQPSGEESRSTLRSKAIKEFSRWEELASPENTLNYNSDGNFLGLVLSNKDFTSWVKQEFQGHDNLARTSIDMEKICLAGATCATLKCLYGGGPANPLCNFCTGVVVGCAITKFFSLW